MTTNTAPSIYSQNLTCGVLLKKNADVVKQRTKKVP